MANNKIMGSSKWKFMIKSFLDIFWILINLRKTSNRKMLSINWGGYRPWLPGGQRFQFWYGEKFVVIQVKHEQHIIEYNGKVISFQDHPELMKWDYP